MGEDLKFVRVSTFIGMLLQSLLPESFTNLLCCCFFVDAHHVVVLGRINFFLRFWFIFWLALHAPEASESAKASTKHLKDNNK